MITNNPLTSITINPAETADKCIIWLHGLGADGNDFVPIVPELHLPSRLSIKFIFPNAPIMPVTINAGYEMRAWFDIYQNDIAAKIDDAGIERSVKQINNMIQDEIDNGIDSANIILAGFSQGAVIALTTGLLYSKPLAGIIALSGLLPNAEKVTANGSAANRDTPIFIGHGSQDAIVSLRLGQLSYETVSKAGYSATWHPYPMGHGVCPEEVHDISRFIQSIWR